MRQLARVFVAALAPMLCASVFAQSPSFVVDLNPRPGPDGSSRPFANRHWIGSHDRTPAAPIVNGIVVFAADVAVPGTPPREFGVEPCGSDGITAWPILDVAPGEAWSEPYGFIPMPGFVLFVANDRTHGHELWVTNGSAASTSMVLDLTPGSDGTNIRDLHPAGSQAFFTVWDQALNRGELWRTDGSAVGTRLLWTAPDGSGLPDHGIAVGSRYFFRGEDAAHGAEPWVSDGSVAGTQRIADVHAGVVGSAPAQFVGFAGGAVFAADDGVHGTELWLTDGTEVATALFSDIRTGANGSDPEQPIVTNGSLFVVADDGVAGRELIEVDSLGVAQRRSDVNPAGDSAIGHLYPAGSNLFLRADALGQFPRTLYVWSTATDTLTNLGTLAPAFVGTIGDTALFATTEDLNVGRELWSSDGTPAGTGLVLDIQAGRGESSPEQLAPSVPMPALNGRLLFSANDGVRGRELWSTDGTAAGTGLVHDLNPVLRTGRFGLVLAGLRRALRSGLFRRE